MSSDFDIAIVGSGFGGSLLAMIARRVGLSVVLLERGRHPRFVIGESSTPLANLLLEELALRFDLPRLLPLIKWGTWQKTYPQIGCGLKRGFTFFHHNVGKPWETDAERRNELLVAASPHDGVADTHWYRPDFDNFLVQEAQSCGVEYLDEVQLESAEISPSAITLKGKRKSETVHLRASFVVDATGPRGFLHRAFSLRETPFKNLPPTQALYSHFSHVERWDKLHKVGSRKEPPYPMDDAAMHHVFEDGWIWVLRFNNGITSAGVAATDELANTIRLKDGAPAWERLLTLLPSVREQFAGARPELPFFHSPRLSFRSEVCSGARWALLPSAAGFVDPLLSTGFPLTLLGISRLARMLERDWNSERWTASLEDYARQTLQELSTAEQLVAALYSSMKDFKLFSAISLLYFAAASFTETARRLGHAELAGESFLLGDHPKFSPRFHDCLQRALRPNGADRRQLVNEIYSTIAPIDIAGLTDRARRNWYYVRASDLFEAAPKLGVSTAEIEGMLSRCGFFK